MSRGAEAIIALLDKLTPAERDEVIAELLRRVACWEHAAPSDETLTTVADQMFLTWDRDEKTRP